MATLRPISAPQDENEGAFRPRGKLESAHEGPPASAAKALGGGRGGTAFNKTPGLTGRKAFGDLTNRTGGALCHFAAFSVASLSNRESLRARPDMQDTSRFSHSDVCRRTGLGKTPGKTPGCGAGTKPASRKILGDITNATPAKQLRAPFEQAAKAAPAPAPAPALTAHTATSAQSRAEAYAEDGIEQRVGKGWLQLEQERLQVVFLHKTRALICGPGSHMPRH